jgi:large subunit ribosomal protein L44
MGPEAIQAQSNYIEWNYNAEMFSFGKRLGETFKPKLLQQAFTHRSYIVQEEMRQRSVGIEQPETNLIDNQQLISDGDRLISDYVTAFLRVSLPNLPDTGLEEVRRYLVGDERLAHISGQLGTSDLVLSDELPVASKTLADTLRAVVAALHASGSGDEVTYKFVRDFVCTQLNQLDLAEVWHIDRPLDVLREICAKQKKGDPEPRLIGDLGKNTILSAYQVGIYCNKHLLGTGFGESVDVAVEEAARNCLHDFFGIGEHQKPFNFELDYANLVTASKKSVKHQP